MNFKTTLAQDISTIKRARDLYARAARQKIDGQKMRGLNMHHGLDFYFVMNGDFNGPSRQWGFYIITALQEIRCDQLTWRVVRNKRNVTGLYDGAQVLAAYKLRAEILNIILTELKKLQS